MMMAESKIDPSTAEASFSNEEGTLSIFSNCPPKEKRKQQVENLNTAETYLSIFLPAQKKQVCLL